MLSRLADRPDTAQEVRSQAAVAAAAADRVLSAPVDSEAGNAAQARRSGPPPDQKPVAPPAPGFRNEYFPEFVGIVVTAGESPEALNAARSIVQDAQTLEALNALKGFAGGAIKDGMKGVLDSLAKQLAKQALDPRKYAKPNIPDPAGRVDEVFRQRGYKVWVVVRYYKIEDSWPWGYRWVEHIKYVEIVAPPGASDFPGYWGNRGPTSEELAKGIADALK